MRILYIDTSSSYLYAGIVENDKLLSEVKKEYIQELSKYALPEISELFNKTKLSTKDIDKIIVVNGPGSFTGIRIGITIAKIYAWSLNIPITTITSIEAMMMSSNSNSYLVPLIDARRGYVFSAIYNDKKEQILKPQYIKFEELKQKLEDINNYVIITNDELDYKCNKETYDPNILKIVLKYKDKEPINPHIVNPEYLKLTEAEENNNK